MEPGKRVVVILPDSIRNYLTKFVDDAWMRRNGFLQTDWDEGTVADLLATLPRRKVITVDATESIERVVELFKSEGISQVPVLDRGSLAGILTESDVLQHLVEGRVGKDTRVAEVMERRVRTLSKHASTSELPRIFEAGEVVIVVDAENRVEAIVTKADLIDLLASRRFGPVEDMAGQGAEPECQS